MPGPAVARRRRSRGRSIAVAVAVTGAVAVLAAGCGGAGAGTEPSTDPGITDEVVLTQAWIRPTPPVTNVGAFYLIIRNGTARSDRVEGASSPRCAEVEIHRTDTVDDVSSMAPAGPADLELPAGGELRFEANGLHIMCLGLDEPVVEGDRIPLTVRLAEAGDLTIEAVAENR